VGAPAVTVVALCVAVGVFTTAVAPARAAQDLPARAAAIDAPLRGAPLPLRPVVVGRATLTPGDEARLHTLLCGGDPCGVEIEGEARLEYRVEDTFSVPVAARNVAGASDLATERRGETLVITERVDGALVWGWEVAAAAGATGGVGVSAAGVAVEPMPAPESPPPAANRAAVPAALPAWANRFLAARYFPPPSHDLLAAAANGAHGQVYALIHGDQESLLLAVDPAAGEENLYRIARSSEPGATFRSGFWAAVLASQPIGRSWREPVRQPAVAVHTAIAVENPEGDRLAVRTRTRLRSRRGGLALWHANLLDHVWDDDGQARRLAASAVRVDGKPASFLHRDGQLLVDLGRELAVGDEVEVEVDSAGDIGFRPVGDSYWQLGTEPWYPRQELDGERATMEISVDVPAAWQPFASGAEVSRETAGGRSRLRTRLDSRVQFATVIAGRYSVVEGSTEALRARAAAYALPNEAASRKLLDKLHSGVTFFEGLFGVPYPFREQSIVEIRDWGFGQAPPGVLYFASEFYTAPVARRTRVYFQDLDARYLHEVAHGWWGHVAKMGSPEDTWVCEGFAEYTAALALWRLRGGDRGDYSFDELVGKWSRAAGDLAPGASLHLVNRLTLEADRNFEDVWRLRYAKGPLVVHAIRLELQRQQASVEEGDRHFIAFLRAVLRKAQEGSDRWGSTQLLVETLDELTGRSWQGWFDRFVYGSEMPDLTPPKPAP
jgi:hypothetical protein